MQNLDYDVLNEIRKLAYEKSNREFIISQRRRYIMLGLLLDDIIESMGPNPNENDPKHRISIVVSTLFDQEGCAENQS